MIKVTKLNKEELIINCNQIECVEVIPESKIILMNKDFYIVTESADEIIDKIIEYNAKIYALHKRITIISNDEEEREC